MSCDDIRRQWDLYHDSEGDARLHWSICQHLESCAECARWFEKQSRFEELLAEQIRWVPADRDLWPRVLGGAGLVRPRANRRWFLVSALVTLAASLFAVVGLTWMYPRDGHVRNASLSHLAAMWHEQLTAGEHRAPFQSDSDLEVEDYLLREVTFPVRCPPRRDSGFAVKGAGTCRLADQPAAFVVGHVDGRPVSLFILSRDSLSRFPLQQEELKRATIHLCREGTQELALSIIDQNLVLVVGQVSRDRLARVLRAYGTYPHRS